MEECYICNFCRKLCKNGNSLRNHERLCKENPERQESSWVKFNHERHDKVRTENLKNEGWQCIERIRWSEYQKLNESEKKNYLKMIFTKLK